MFRSRGANGIMRICRWWVGSDGRGVARSVIVALLFVVGGGSGRSETGGRQVMGSATRLLAVNDRRRGIVGDECMHPHPVRHGDRSGIIRTVGIVWLVDDERAGL